MSKHKQILTDHPPPWSVSTVGNMTYICDARNNGIISLHSERFEHLDQDSRVSRHDQMKKDINVCKFIIEYINSSVVG
jgi:hypothetical protein